MVYLPCSERFRTQPAIQKLKIINLRENVPPYQHEGSDFFTYEFTLTREIMGVNIISIMFFIASLVRSLLSHWFTLDLDLCISVDSNHVVEPVHVSYERINDLYSLDSHSIQLGYMQLLETQLRTLHSDVISNGQMEHYRSNPSWYSWIVSLMIHHLGCNNIIIALCVYVLAW